jgi:hypothetical protein
LLLHENADSQDPVFENLFLSKSRRTNIVHKVNNCVENYAEASDGVRLTKIVSLKII